MAKILIVDDSETARMLVKNLLEPIGHSVVEAFNGSQGLELIQANPDLALVICDMNMHILDGLGMCQRLTEIAGAPKPPIVMLSTEADPKMIIKAKSVGVTAWATKPFSSEKLLSLVQKILKT